MVVLSASDSPSASSRCVRSPDSLRSMSSSLASITELLSARSVILRFSFSFSTLSPGSPATWADRGMMKMWN